MRFNCRVMVAAIIIAGLQLAACEQHSSTYHVEHPVEVKKIGSSNLSSVTLTDKAIQRLDLKTDSVREQAGKKVVPYSSLIYDPNGQTWIYISPQPRTFVRHKVEVDKIEADTVILTDGPPVGTVVASVAVAELYGAEFKVGH